MAKTITDRLIELEDRVVKLEGLVGVPQATTLLPHKCECKETDEPILNTGRRPPPFGEGTLIRKPIMYLYNLSGTGMQCTVDFKSTDLHESVPEVRKDNKLVFDLDADSYINAKYRYLYYEINAPDGLPKSNMYAYIRNDKNLYSDLEKLAIICSLYGKESTDFVSYWELELSRLECPYYKCEILTEAKLDKLFPIDISPLPGYFIRRYIKFSPAEKLGKSQVEGLERKPRMGELRVIEWGGFRTGDKIIR